MAVRDCEDGDEAELEKLVGERLEAIWAAAVKPEVRPVRKCLFDPLVKFTWFCSRVATKSCTCRVYCTRGVCLTCFSAERAVEPNGSFSVLSSLCFPRYESGRGGLVFRRDVGRGWDGHALSVAMYRMRVVLSSSGSACDFRQTPSPTPLPVVLRVRPRTATRSRAKKRLLRPARKQIEIGTKVDSGLRERICERGAVVAVAVRNPLVYPRPCCRCCRLPLTFPFDGHLILIYEYATCM